MQQLFNSRGVGERLGVTSERARQLIKEGRIRSTAILNGKGLLVDEVSLRQFEEQRRQKRTA